MAGSGAVGQGQARTSLIMHAILFVLGFTAVFSLAGFSFGLIGQGVDQYRQFINLVVGIALVIVCLHVAGVIRNLAFALAGGDHRSGLMRGLAQATNWLAATLYRQGQVSIGKGRTGYRASFGVGVAFALGWSPCVGFILGGILTAAYNSESIATAYLLLISYSLGIGLPFIVLAAFAEPLQGPLSALNRRSNVIAIVSGTLLALFGLFIAFDLTSTLTRLLVAVPIVSDEFLMISDGSINLGWLLPAFIAGLLSFLSPCVLPLAPVYLAHLAGQATSRRTLA